VQVVIYLSLSLIWMFILYNFISRYKTLAPDNPKVNALVKAYIIISIAFMIDSLYWTIFNCSFIGLLPKHISDVLGSNENVFMIKILLLVAAIYVGIIIRRKKIEEIALESKEKKEIENLNIELTERNKEILKFHHVIKGISECVFIADLEGNITFINDALTKLLEYEDCEITGKSFLNLFPEKKQQDFYKIIDSTITKGRWEEELKVLKKNGQTVLVLLSTSVIKDKEVNPMYFVGIFRDITQKKLWEEQMMQAEKLTSIGQLIAGVTHELNNPLTGIMGFAQFLQINPKCDEEMKHDLETINKEAIRAKDIVQNLMVFARNHEIKHQIISINDVLKETVNLFGYEVRKGKIKVIEELEEDLPRVTGDYHQFQQVFLNIATNSIQAMGEEGGTITIKTEKVNNNIKINISDTGPGIKPEILSKVFDPFFTTKKVGEGTGLGLSVSYGIIKQYKGKIYVQSNPGEGAKFIIELPETETIIDEK